MKLFFLSEKNTQLGCRQGRSCYAFQILENSKGLSSGVTLIIVSLLFLLPAVFMGASDGTKTMFDLQTRGRWQQKSSDYAAVALTSIKSSYSCTENIRAMGLIATSYTGLEGKAFYPRLVNTDGSLGAYAHATLANWLGTEVKLKSSYLEFPKPGDPTSAIRPNPTTVKVNWRMDFIHNDSAATDSIKAGFIKSERLPIILAIDGSGNIVNCTVTKTVQNALMEDLVCKTLNGASAQYDQKDQKCI